MQQITSNLQYKLFAYDCDVQHKKCRGIFIAFDFCITQAGKFYKSRICQSHVPLTALITVISITQLPSIGKTRNLIGYTGAFYRS